jgi:uncharacterized NAD-dependent epimerase/dehydratase family protein
LIATLKPAKVIGIALNTRAYDEAAARAEIAKASEITGLPAQDVVRFGAEDFYAAISPGIVKRQPARA